MVVGPAAIAKIANLQRDFLVCKGASLVHVVSLHLGFLAFLGLLLRAHLLFLEVALDLTIEVSLHGQFPSAILVRARVKHFVLRVRHGIFNPL